MTDEIKIQLKPGQSFSMGRGYGAALCAASLDEAADQISKLPGFQYAKALIAKIAADERTEICKVSMAAASKAGVDLTRYRLSVQGWTVIAEPYDLTELADMAEEPTA